MTKKLESTQLMLLVPSGNPLLEPRVRAEAVQALAALLLTALERPGLPAKEASDEAH